MKKSIVKIGGLLMLSAFALTSCHKTVTPRKLDGEWTVTSGSSTGSSTYNSSTSTYSTSFDGSKETITEDGEATINDKTISIVFDKKAGTYVRTTVETTTTISSYTYYESMFSTYYAAGSFDKKDKYVATTVENGTFTITGGTGEIEKNTQIVMNQTSSTETGIHTYSYYDGSAQADLSNKYTSTGGAIPTTSTTSNTSTTKSSSADLLTVTSLKKGVMEIDISSSSNETYGANTYSSTTTGTMTLTKK